MTTNALPQADRISAAQLRELQALDPQIRLLDVRTGGEFETAHIPESYNVPLDTLVHHLEGLADVDHPVVLICQTGGRASQAHDKLSAAGKDTLHILEGGMQAWQASGGDVSYGDTARWGLDRQVRLVAGTLALASVALSTVVPGAKWIAAGVGFGLAFSAVTNTCAMGMMLAKLPYNRADECDIENVLAGLNRKAA